MKKPEEFTTRDCMILISIIVAISILSGMSIFILIISTFGVIPSLHPQSCVIHVFISVTCIVMLLNKLRAAIVLKFPKDK